MASHSWCQITPLTQSCIRTSGILGPQRQMLLPCWPPQTAAARNAPACLSANSLSLCLRGKTGVVLGADVKKIGPAGRSPLGEACRTDNVRVVQTVVGSGADIEQENPYYKNATPVVIAVICKNPKVVEYLISVRQLCLVCSSSLRGTEGEICPRCELPREHGSPTSKHFKILG